MSSYIAFELDALNKCPHVAMAAGLRVADVSHGLLMLWSHCFREETDKVADKHLNGFFGAKGIGEHLEAFGFLEDADGMWRVKGASRYLRLRETRREGGRKGRAKQLEARAEPGVNPGSKGPARTGPKTRQAQPGVSPDSKSPNEPGPKRALKSPDEPGSNRALSPSTEGALLTESTVRAASAPEPCAVDAPQETPAGACVSGAESSDPFRPQAFGEAWHDFAMRYPWPDVPTLSLIEPDARSALFRQAASEKRPPIVLLNELVTERQRYAVGAGGVH